MNLQVTFNMLYARNLNPKPPKASKPPKPYTGSDRVGFMTSPMQGPSKSRTPQNNNFLQALLFMIQTLHYLKDPKLWEIMVNSLLWVMQKLYHQLYGS